MGKRFYRFCRVLVRVFTKPMRTEWAEQPDDGPYVFAVNHDGAHGPLLMCAHFPLRDQCHPWINAPVYDREQMPEYVLHDFWWKPGCFWEPVLKRTVPYIAAALVPPLMNGADGIPIYRDQRVMTTFRESIKILKKNEHIVIFTDGFDENGVYKDEIHTGWLALGELYYKATGQVLRIFPVYVDKKERVFHVSKAVLFDPSRRYLDQKDELAAKIAPGIGKSKRK